MLQERIQNGQSIKDFCMSVGISRNTYFYWQRKLREAACTELAVREQARETKLVPGGWARLETPNAQVPAAVSVEINGCRIEVTAETDSELLAKVCRTLKSL